MAINCRLPCIWLYMLTKQCCNSMLLVLQKAMVHLQLAAGSNLSFGHSFIYLWHIQCLRVASRPGPLAGMIII